MFVSAIFGINVVEPLPGQAIQVSYCAGAMSEFVSDKKT